VAAVEAAADSRGGGKVAWVARDGPRRTVDVVLGLSDGKVVEIKKGLKGGETVAVPGPNLPTAAPAGGDQPSGMPG